MGEATCLTHRVSILTHETEARSVWTVGLLSLIRFRGGMCKLRRL
jgi:hypothetical protein